MKPVVGLTPEKNCRDSVAARAPYRKKSYHSKTVPRAAAKMMRRCPCSMSSAALPTVLIRARYSGATKIARALPVFL